MLINRKGSCLVEAAISLPVFIIAVIVMSSVILMYACIEDCTFIAANELRRGAAEAVIVDTSITVPYRIRKAIEKNHSQVHIARLRDAGFRCERWGIDELILVDFRLGLKTNNPLGIKAEADYDLALATRAYVGRERDESNMSAEEFADEDAEAVYIFPKRGEKYHSKGCTFLRAASTSAALSGSIRRKYKACPLCHSSSAEDGALIYYFPADGEDYHLPGCPSLQRNYIEIERGTALRRGYTACSKCGG
ncbi:MAG: hypothetical protein IJH64_06710 [Oscillospiraceae bacterium]|nr:hypothetical protein [Oscillospiraceae bacterium]